MTVMGLQMEDIENIQVSELRKFDFLSLSRRIELSGGSRAAGIVRGRALHPQCRDEYHMWPMRVDVDGNDDGSNDGVGVENR